MLKPTVGIELHKASQLTYSVRSTSTAGVDNGERRLDLSSGIIHILDGKLATL